MRSKKDTIHTKSERHILEAVKVRECGGGGKRESENHREWGEKRERTWKRRGAEREPDREREREEERAGGEEGGRERKPEREGREL